MSTRRWKCVYNRKLFSFCLPESRRPSRRACWGHPDNHEHSDVIQQWNWDVAKEVDQPSLLSVEGLCRQCLAYRRDHLLHLFSGPLTDVEMC